MAKIELSEVFVQKLINDELEQLAIVRVSPKEYAVVLSKPVLNLGMHYSYRTHLMLTKTDAGVYQGKFPLPPFIAMGIFVGLGAFIYDVLLLRGTGVNKATLVLAVFLLVTVVVHAAAEARIRNCLLQ